ncbi:MAG: SpoIIE family protein phosphatase [Chloracidobacterium sp.]
MYSLVIHSPNAPPHRVLLVKPRYTLGRSVRADIMVADPFASRIHAVLQHDGKAYILEDLESANGTYYQGERVKKPLLLKTGDCFRIGETNLELALEQRPTQVAAPSVTYFTTSSNTVPEAQIGLGHVRTTDEIVNRAVELSSGVSVQTATEDAPVEPMAGLGRQPGAVAFLGETKIGRQRPGLLALVSKVGVTLLSNASLDETLSEIMALVFESLPVERGFLLTYNHDTRELECRLARTKDGPLPLGDVMVCQSITEQVMTTKSALLTSDARHDPRFAGSQSIVLGDIRSVMGVPLIFCEQIYGLIYVENPYVRRFTPDDLEVLTTIASVAAVKIENLRLLEEQMKRQRLQAEIALAARIQASMLPQCEPHLAGFEVAGLSRPAEDIGGDYYDYIKVGEERLAVVIGDASGHGVSSGLLMALAKGALFNQLGMACDPVSVMQTLNKLIHENGTRRDLMTFCYALLELPTGLVTVANAGHPYPLLYSASQRTLQSLALDHYPLGVRPTLGPLPVSTHQLGACDVLVLYSDGIPELKNRTGRYFGYDGLEATIHRCAHLQAREICEAIVETALTFASGAIPEDDITVVVIKRTA